MLEDFEVCSRFSWSSDASYFYYQQADYPKDCQEVYNQCTNTTDGIYLIKPDGYTEPFEVFCNNTIDGGGWTVGYNFVRFGEVLHEWKPRHISYTFFFIT